MQPVNEFRLAVAAGSMETRTWLSGDGKLPNTPTASTFCEPDQTLFVLMLPSLLAGVAR